MAYGDGGENLALLKRTITGVVDFAGRSRRTELICYWIAAALLEAVIRFIGSVVLPWKASLVVGLILQIMLAIPIFALFARRLHDQDRSAWWALILPVMLGLNVLQSLRFIALDSEKLPSIPEPGLAFVLWIGPPLVLAVLILSFLPGTKGENRFGQDPREGG